MKKRIMTGNSEIEIEDTDSVERMRHRDTDGDGVVDYIDSNGYSKPSDKYRYKEVSIMVPGIWTTGLKKCVNMV